MEGTPLRSVPTRPAGPVGRPQALAVVEKRLPDLAPPARRALALVALVGVSREQTARELGVPPAELSRLLASARKALRRTLEPLPSGGWCERAERLISDRLDGELEPRSGRRLDAHLPACERCQTHERRLVQAHDELVAALDSARPVVPELRLVEGPKALMPGPPPAAEPVVAEPDVAAADVAEPDGAAADVAEPDAAEPAATPEPPVAEPAVTEDLPAELAAVVERSLERRIAALVWQLAFALAVLLAVATVVITVLGATGTIRHVP
jgi:putative zinc finger protein